MKRDLKTYSFSGLEKLLEEMGEKSYHARQLALWIWQRGITDFAQLTDISKSCRFKLSEKYYISELILICAKKAKDNSCKYIFRLSDGLDIESVLIPDGDRLTLCISTQVGCRQGCRFCLTAKMGFVRNLLTHEIVDQILQVKRKWAPTPELQQTCEFR